VAALRDLTVRVQVHTHGGLESGRVGVLRRTLALWCIGLAQWLLQTRLDIDVVEA
jgi:hypothetical protein